MPLNRNDFETVATFLKAADDERGTLLETLTGSAIYSDISIRAHERAKQEAQALQRLLGRLADQKPLDADKFFPWVQDLVQKEGPNILRCKGILSFKDDPERFAFQGVHMILDGDHQRPWRDDERRGSRIIFIGRNLPQEQIREGFAGCMA